MKFQNTSHGNGRKKILVPNIGSKSNLTQFAYGELDPGDIIEDHRHPTMEEFFYFIEGTGLYLINGKSVSINPGQHVKIPANTYHSLECRGEEILKFIYFGIKCSKEGI